MEISVNTNPNNINHVKNDYTVEKIFGSFPSDQKKLTFVNGTAAERTIKAGTLVGITTADQTVGKVVKSDASDGSQIPVGILLYDTVIVSGASEEKEALVGFNGSVYENMIVLEKSGDTLDTVVTETGQSIKNSLLNANSRIQLLSEAVSVSDFKDAQV